MSSNSAVERFFAEMSGDESSGSEEYECSAQDFIYPCDNGSKCIGEHSFSREKYRHDEANSIQSISSKPIHCEGDQEVDQPSPRVSPGN
ncbi:unnamed protein product [Rhodiola kirilowii]